MLFYQKLQDITFIKSLTLIVALFEEGMMKLPGVTEEQVESVVNYAVSALPGYLQRSLMSISRDKKSVAGCGITQKKEEKALQADYKRAQDAVEQVSRVILGKEKEVREVMLAFLANGHILLEDIPGVGKTTLAMAYSKVLALDYGRVQFTPDVMPSDLTGFSIYQREQEAFVYQKGAVFCNLLLADEINRTSPKTQSALLEVMEERRVTVEGVTREVPDPFLVIATQNPFGSFGTQYLPEAQVDRFMVSMTLGYPDFDHELSMAMSVGEGSRLDGIEPLIDRETLLRMQRAIHDVYIKEEVYRYMLELVTATRNHPYLEWGASPRATIAMVKMTKAAAWLEGRDYVTPNDVREQFPYVAAHRIVLDAAAKMDHMEKGQVIGEIVQMISAPVLGEAAV